MWSNTNTNIYYSNNIRILFEYRIIRSPLTMSWNDPFMKLSSMFFLSWWFHPLRSYCFMYIVCESISSDYEWPEKIMWWFQTLLVSFALNLDIIYYATFLVHAMVKVWEIRSAILANATILAQWHLIKLATMNCILHSHLWQGFQKSASIPFLFRTSGYFIVKLARLPLILNGILPWAFSSFFFELSLFWSLWTFPSQWIWFEMLNTQSCVCAVHVLCL